MRLSYINQLDLPVDYIYDGYQIGGLSGIDYDPKTDTYYAVSDNGANGKPSAIYAIRFTGLQNKDGTPQVKFEQTPIDLTNISDVESIRRDPNGDGFWVSAEEAIPSVYHYHSDGSVTKLETLPENIENASQIQKSLKGSTFTPDGSYFVSSERNLTSDTTGYTRITKFAADGSVIAQYAYYTDRPSTIGATSNGISEILAIDNNRLLVMERGYNETADASTGKSVCPVRIYEIDLTNAQNVLNISNLTSDNTTLVNKTLVFDSMSPSINNVLNTSETRFDNIEGMTFGPPLADGTKTLVLVSDNNYNTAQNKTQFISLSLGTGLHYINQATLPVGYTYTDSNGNSYQIGGLSGIDYDPKTDTYIVESDHQPGTNVSVVYTVQFTGLFNSDGTPQVKIKSARPLYDANGNKVYDAESIRFDPNGDGFWITTEQTTPSIYHYHADGSVTKLTVPDNIVTRTQNNLGLEGSTFSPDGSYFVSMERNLTGDATGFSRITKFAADGSVEVQYAYYTDKPSTIDATSNGISEILALDNNTLLVMERGHNSNQDGTTGNSVNRVRIYKVSLVGAQNVLDITNLDLTNTRLLTKTLVFDSMDPEIVNKLNTTGTRIDNLEGMTLGPKLPDGRQTIILVSDNNFNSSQYKTQFISFVLDDGEACYLEGTYIKTQKGLKHVEDIISGDLIYVFEDNNWYLREVVWVGKQQVVVNPAYPDDQSGYPICIRKNAFEDNVPFADLYITAEHCMFFENTFIPARMLVNGKTVFYDRSFDVYDYYHIETKKHSVISANGTLSESYLDTGNRHYFSSMQQPLCHDRVKEWCNDAAAPLMTEANFVERIFKQLDQRADLLNIVSVDKEKIERTHNPDLRLMVDNDKILYPIAFKDSKVYFDLDTDIKNIRLLSKTYRPCDIYGPFVDDRRIFGVLVGNISIEVNNEEIVINSHLNEKDLSGWLSQDQSNMRWTSGNGLIPFELNHVAEGAKLSVHIIGSGSYSITD